jgi:3-oxoacyl-[acyl-carrier protein] reductase
MPLPWRAVDLGLKGRTALVCGASSGLALASAEALAEEGANVTMFARRRDVLERESDRIGALAVRGDVTNLRDLERLVERTLEAFGGVDVLVWNGGGPPPGGALDITDESLEQAVELLLLPPLRLLRLCLPHLERSAAGRVIAITSVAVLEPTPHLALSNTIRPAVTGWAKTLARELGPRGITVNCVAPGRIETPRLEQLYPGGPSDTDLGEIPLGRWGTPREFADVACFLASDRAAYVTGTVVPVDGGLKRGLL